MSGQPIYLDYNATTPVDTGVFDLMAPWFTARFGNAASSTHPYGWSAAEAVKMAREQVAALIGADPSEIVFTSGSTEALNLALQGAMARYAAKGDHLITATTEHKAVLDTCKWLEREGKRVTYLPVDGEGRIGLAELEAAIVPETVLICLMWANNETGLVSPMAQISEIAKRHEVLLLTDATQAAGKLPVDVNAAGIDMLSLSAHKFYGPKGVGALYVRRRNPRVSLLPLIHGGGHERGMRSGTLNVPGIVGMGAAAALATEKLDAEATRQAAMRDRLEAALLALPGARRNGAKEPRLPNTANLSFADVEADSLIDAMRGIAVSTGSACTSANLEPSHVLRAMGIEDDEAYASIRFSLGRPTSEEDVDAAITIVKAAVARLRADRQ